MLSEHGVASLFGEGVKGSDLSSTFAKRLAVDNGSFRPGSRFQMRLQDL